MFSEASFRIIRINVDGTADVVAGDPNGDFFADGVPATEVPFNGQVLDMEVDADGNLWINGSSAIGITNWNYLKKINTEEVISNENLHAGCIPAEGQVLGSACLDLNGFFFNPEGKLFMASRGFHKIQQVASPLPGFNVGNYVLPSEDGSVLYTFDATGRHLETHNTTTGAVIFTFAYDSLGRMDTITDGDGDVTTIQRDGDGKPTAIVSHDGLVTTLNVDANGYLVGITAPDNNTTSFVYDDRGLMTSKTDARNNTNTFEYNDEGGLIKDTGPEGGTLELARTGPLEDYVVTITTGEGRVNSFETDTLGGGMVTKATDTSGIVTQSVVQSNDTRVTTSPVAPSVTPTTTISGVINDPRFGRLAPLRNVRVVTPSGLNFFASPSRTTTPSNPGNPLSITGITDTLNINGSIFTSQYNKVDPNTNPSAFRFIDTSPEGRVTTTFVDDQGRIVEVQPPGVLKSSFSYDARGRLTGSSQGTAIDERENSISYNAQGFINSITDPLGRVVSYQYDGVGRVTKQVFPDLREVNFTYDENGNVKTITPPSRPPHVITYNKENLTTNYNPPDIGLPQHATMIDYNLDKQPTLITRPDGQTITFSYDANGRFDTLTIPFGGGTGVYSYSYDPDTGKLFTVITPALDTLSFTLDGNLPLSTTWSGDVNGSVSRVYDNNFNITSRSVNGGHTVTSTYDKDFLLTSIGSQTQTFDPATGFLTGTTLGIITDSYIYNGSAEKLSYTANVSGSPVFETSFVRDKLGRITQKTETANAITRVFDYDYDMVGRLIEVKEGGLTTATYTYDGNSNRLNGEAVYDDQDRLVSNNSTTYTYTANGDLLTKTVGSDTTTYDYDVLGNLLSVTLPNGDLIEYINDASNRRIGKKINGILVQGWLYMDTLNPIAELDGLGNVVSRFVYATSSNIPDYLIKGGVTYRLISDHLGSPRLLVNTDDGSIVQKMDFDEWGNILIDTNPGFQPFGFAGGLYDLSTGLVRFGARDYDTEVGRWTNKDPIKFDGGLNLYGYTFADPVNLIDPTGLIPCPWCIGFIVGAGVDLASQVLENGGFNCFKLDLPRLAVAGALGALGGGGAGKFFNGLKKSKPPKPSISPPISKQKQAGHIPGTPQNKNRIKQGKPTSNFFGEKSGNRLTQEAWEKGKPISAKSPHVKEHDFGVPTGIGGKGGYQTKVRVTQDSKGRIHGHPSGPER